MHGLVMRSLGIVGAHNEVICAGEDQWRAR
jgi:hypothetical protein